jgi:CheY-like chemotaxis protein
VWTDASPSGAPDPDRVDVTSILIVDDDDDLRLLLRVTLSDRGYDIVGEASDGRQGVAYAAQLQPDAIILDLTMSPLDGLEALPMFAEVAPATPVIVLTADADDQTATRVRALGAFSLLTKPTTIARLAEVLNDATTATV